MTETKLIWLTTVRLSSYSEVARYGVLSDGMPTNVIREYLKIEGEWVNSCFYNCDTSDHMSALAYTDDEFDDWLSGHMKVDDAAFHFTSMARGGLPLPPSEWTWPIYARKAA